jgi:hypothetical protein
MFSTATRRTRTQKKRVAHPAYMNRHAYWLLLLLLVQQVLVAAAAAGCCC